MTVEEIKAISPTNIVSAISMLTPGLRLIENNQAGSNPNRLRKLLFVELLRYPRRRTISKSAVDYS